MNKIFKNRKAIRITSRISEIETETQQRKSIMEINSL
jgi:hypothetical protein